MSLDTLSASMARTRRENCQTNLHARGDSPTQKADISELEKTGHFCFALTEKADTSICCQQRKRTAFLGGAEYQRIDQFYLARYMSAAL